MSKEKNVIILDISEWKKPIEDSLASFKRPSFSTCWISLVCYQISDSNLFNVHFYNFSLWLCFFFSVFRSTFPISSVEIFIINSFRNWSTQCSLPMTCLRNQENALVSEQALFISEAFIWLFSMKVESFLISSPLHLFQAVTHPQKTVLEAKVPGQRAWVPATPCWPLTQATWKRP